MAYGDWAVRVDVSFCTHPFLLGGSTIRNSSMRYKCVDRTKKPCKACELASGQRPELGVETEATEL